MFTYPFACNPVPTFTTGCGWVQCGHCGNFHQGTCPRIKEIEYWPDGTVKRVVYHGGV